CPSARNASFAGTVAALGAARAPRGRQVMLGHTGYDRAREGARVRAALAWAPAAIVLTGLEHAPDTRALLQRARVPVVEMWERGPRPIDMGVGFAHPDVGAAAARRLLAGGRRRLAFCGARMQEDRRAAQRAEGFAAAARAAGAAPEILNHPGPADPQAGALLLDRALGALPDLDGIAASNDTVALGVLFEAQRRGIAVPDTLAVVGFGDLPVAGACVPPLTTIRPSGDLVGREVARLVLARMRGDPVPERAVDTGFVLVERVSG
ncbi:MAG: substrate-binding domain-containing protein, partial [Salinarimonas sp.]